MNRFYININIVKTITQLVNFYFVANLTSISISSSVLFFNIVFWLASSLNCICIKILHHIFEKIEINSNLNFLYLSIYKLIISITPGLIIILTFPQIIFIKSMNPRILI